MKKFSKLIQEKKKVLLNMHPLVNPVDWDEIFKPLIEHIDSNLKSKVEGPGEGIFSSKTKGALDELIDSITEDYVQYFQDVIDDGTPESFFTAYQLKIRYEELQDCLVAFTDRTNESKIEENPDWDGGYYQYIFKPNLKYESTDELIEDVVDVFHKLKIYKTNFKIYIHSSNHGNSTFILDTTEVEKIPKFIKNLLELPSENPRQWINGLRGISIFIFNKETVQAADL